MAKILERPVYCEKYSIPIEIRIIKSAFYIKNSFHTCMLQRTYDKEKYRDIKSFIDGKCTSYNYLFIMMRIIFLSKSVAWKIK